MPGLKEFEAQFDSSEVRSDPLSLLTDEKSTSYITTLKLRKHIQVLLVVLLVLEFPCLKEVDIRVASGDTEYEWLSSTAVLDVQFFPQALENLFTSSSSPRVT